MNNSLVFDEALNLVLGLSRAERLSLLVKLAVSLEEPKASNPHEGLLALLEAEGPVEFVNPEITDPVDWVNAQRQKESERLRAYWESE